MGLGDETIWNQLCALYCGKPPVHDSLSNILIPVWSSSLHYPASHIMLLSHREEDTQAQDYLKRIPGLQNS